MDQPILVVAGHYIQFNHWMRTRRLRERKDAVYIGENSHRLRGVHGATVVFTDYWWRRRDSEEIDNQIKYLVAVAHVKVRHEPTLLEDANDDIKRIYEERFR